MSGDNVTRAWRLYESGVRYNHSLTPDQYAVVETNTEFFSGNQWLNAPDTPAMRRLPKPVFNILERVASLFIASLTSSAVAIRVEPLARYAASPDLYDPQQDKETSEYANAALSNLLEKLKFDYRVREALYDGAVSGDYCAHLYFDPDAKPYGGAFVSGEMYAGEIVMELADGINVHFGNPNDRNVQNQPYVLIVGRDTVANLRAEAKRHSGGDIQADTETDNFPGTGGKVELDEDAETGNGKALYVILYEKKGGTVHVTKATRNAVIYEDIDTGLSLYPIAWGNWRTQKNQYHGRALITSLIANQIEINRMFAVSLRHLQSTAFPKVIYDAGRIDHWSDAVGEPIAVHGLEVGQRIPDIATSFQVPEMSGQISNFIDKVLAYTKECMGATDAQMGNVKPDNTSALMVLQTNAEVPLENIRAGLHEWTEDIGHILLDMMGTYYGARPVIAEREFPDTVEGPDGMPLIDPASGLLATRTVKEKVAEWFDFSRFKNLALNLRVDVGATTYFSEIAMTQTLDNLRRDGMLSAVEYLRRVPDKLIPQKEELIAALESGAGTLPEGASGGGGPSMGGALSAERMEAGLPTSIQASLSRLPGTARRAARVVGNLRASR